MSLTATPVLAFLSLFFLTRAVDGDEDGSEEARNLRKEKEKMEFIPR